MRNQELDRLMDDEGRKAGVYSKALVQPATGEVIDLRAPSVDLAIALDQVRDLESKLREVKGEVGGELLRRMDQAREWTMREGDYELRAPSDAPKEEWDVDRLVVVLTDLVDKQLITSSAMDAAVEQVIEWKPRAKGLNALRKSPALAEAIDGCKTEVSNERRYVSVKRKGSV